MPFSRYQTNPSSERYLKSICIQMYLPVPSFIWDPCNIFAHISKGISQTYDYNKQQVTATMLNFSAFSIFKTFLLMTWNILSKTLKTSWFDNKLQVNLLWVSKKCKPWTPMFILCKKYPLICIYLYYFPLISLGL